MRHALLTAAVDNLRQPPSPGTGCVDSATSRRALVAASSFTLSLPSGLCRAGMAAVALPPIARPAQEHLSSAASTKQHARRSTSRRRGLGSHRAQTHRRDVVHHLPLAQNRTQRQIVLAAGRAREPGAAKLCLTHEPERIHAVGCVKGSLRRAAPALDPAHRNKCRAPTKPPPHQRIEAVPDQRSQAVLEARKRLQGDEHPDTLTSINNLAITLWHQGEAPSARNLMAMAVAGYLSTLGAAHPNTANAQRTLAHMQGSEKP
jgi:hypothetical protein